MYVIGPMRYIRPVNTTHVAPTGLMKCWRRLLSDNAIGCAAMDLPAARRARHLSCHSAAEPLGASSTRCYYNLSSGASWRPGKSMEESPKVRTDKACRDAIVREQSFRQHSHSPAEAHATNEGPNALRITDTTCAAPMSPEVIGIAALRRLSPCQGSSIVKRPLLHVRHCSSTIRSEARQTKETIPKSQIPKRRL